MPIAMMTIYRMNYRIQNTTLEMHPLEKQVVLLLLLSSFLGSTAQLTPWPPPQNPAEFLGGFSTIFFFTG
jgi:hypothetical protein